MRTRISRMLCVATLLLGLSSVASAQSMKLLAPGVGWIFQPRNEVLWTSDGGKNWKNITPPVPPDSVISAIFFLDTEHGWILFAHGDVVVGLNYDLATTDNGGASWSTAPVTLPLPSGPGGGAWLAFADQDHGWLALGSGVSPISRGNGTLFATSNGGRTWVVPDNSHTCACAGAGPVVMVTPQFGWLVGGQNGDVLYVTRDSAKAWQRVVLESPVRTDLMREYDQRAAQFWQSFLRNIPPAAVAESEKTEKSQDHTYATYDLPVFKDPSHGHIVVAYPGITVLFGTDDGGVTWKPEASVTGRVLGESAVVNSTWITADVPRDRAPQLRKLGAGGSAAANTELGPQLSLADGTSFVTPSQGWVLTSDDRLFSTSDGGASWTDVTPAYNGRHHIRR